MKEINVDELDNSVKQDDDKDYEKFEENESLKSEESQENCQDSSLIEEVNQNLDSKF